LTNKEDNPFLCYFVHVGKQEVRMTRKVFKFYDQIELEFRAGGGGEGSSSRIRVGDHPMNVGGDGGEGGDIWVEADDQLFDLSEYAARPLIKSSKGNTGDSYRKKGAKGDDATIYVPVGTLLRNDSGDIIAELMKHKERFQLAKGGYGGLGNFKKQQTYSPKLGEEGLVVLDYRIPVDVVLVGSPNSGKTSFMRKVTGTDVFVPTFYPYATWHPMWGKAVCEWFDYQIMEMPALAGKPEEVERVLKYVRQIFRAKVLVYFLDGEIENFEEVRAAVEETIRAVDESLLEGKQVVVVSNKCDIARVDIPGVINISLETGEGVDALNKKLYDMVKPAPAQARKAIDDTEETSAA
jgi:GTP-binding protein